MTSNYPDQLVPPVAGSYKIVIMANRKFKSDSYRIENEKDYNALMKKIDALMKIPENKLTDKEASELRAMALGVQTYEESIYTIPAPKTLEGLIELKMYERKLKQKELARMLGIGEPKLSQIMNKKRKPDIAFLKAANKLLGIDGNVLLDFA